MSVQNYHRFYASLNRLPGGNTEDMKESLVWSFTDGRTTSLKEMTQKEYNAMCASLEERTGWKEQLKKKRSLCLKLMQKAGIDTTDWQRINDFCRNPKIAGKEFAQLGVKDLDALQVKLRAIMRKASPPALPRREGALKASPPALPRREGAQEAATEIPEQSSPTRSLSQHIRQEVTYIAVPLVGMGQA